MIGKNFTVKPKTTYLKSFAAKLQNAFLFFCISCKLLYDFYHCKNIFNKSKDF
jgi:hypothetical protein